MRCRQHLLGPRDALLDRGMAAHEGARDFVHAEAAQDVQDQRDLRFLRQPRMAAGEHHAQQVVLDRVRGEQLLDHRHERPFAFEQPPELGCEGLRRALAPQHVERPVLGGGHQPRRRIFRHALELPDLCGAAEGVLHDVFRQRQVVDAEDPGQGGDHAPRLASEQMVARLHLHVHDLHLTDLHRASEVEDRTAVRKLGRMRKVFGFDERVAADDVLRLRIGAVVDGFLLAPDHLAGLLQGMPEVLDVPLFAEILEPRDPFLQVLLHLFGGQGGVPAAIEKREFAHRVSSRVRMCIFGRSSIVAADMVHAPIKSGMSFCCEFVGGRVPKGGTRTHPVDPRNERHVGFQDCCTFRRLREKQKVRSQQQVCD